MPGAPTMYFRTQRMPTDSVRAGAGLAGRVLEESGLEVYSRQDSFAAGTTPNSHAVIACLPAPDGFHAVIMVSGDESQSVLERLSDRLSKFVLID